MAAARGSVSVRPFLIYLVVASSLMAAIWLLFQRFPFHAFDGIAVPAGQENWIGHWHAPEADLYIPRRGNVVLKRYAPGANSSFDLPLLGLDDKAITLGLGFWTTQIIVEAPPHQVNGQWQVRAAHVDFIKQN